MHKSYKKGEFFFQILYSSLMTFSSIACANSLVEVVSENWLADCARKCCNRRCAKLPIFVRRELTICSHHFLVAYLVFGGRMKTSSMRRLCTFPASHFVRRLPCWLKPYANHAIFTVSNCKRQSFSFAFIHRTGTPPIGKISPVKGRVEETVGECTEETILRRRNHVEYLLKALDGLSAGFVGLDASKPWMCYWILHALDLLQHKIGTGLATRYILLKLIY
jgi:hypothetical protein